MTTYAAPTGPHLRPGEGVRVPQPDDSIFEILDTTLRCTRIPAGPSTHPFGERRDHRPAPMALSRSAPRQRILARLIETPGLHLRALRRSLGIELSSLEHHLCVLRRQGHAASRSFGHYKAFFPVAGLDRRDWEILFFLHQEQAGRILLLLANTPSADHACIAAALGVGPATCSFHLKKLHRAGLVERQTSRPHILWSLREPSHVADLIRRYMGPHVAVAPRDAGPRPVPAGAQDRVDEARYR